MSFDKKLFGVGIHGQKPVGPGKLKQAREKLKQSRTSWDHIGPNQDQQNFENLGLVGPRTWRSMDTRFGV